MIRRDLEALVEIAAAGSMPWTEEEFLQTLRRRDCIGMVAEQGDTVVGFMVYELRKRSLNLINFGVHPDHRGTGVGSQLLGRLTRKTSSHRRTRITADVREMDLELLLWMRRRGFRAAGVLRGHFEDTGEDAYAMRTAECRDGRETP